MAKKRKSLLGKLRSMKATATGKAWEALHRAEASIARGEGRIRKGAGGRPKKRKGKKQPKQP